MNEREIELYIHIPFCVRKCKYCDFLSGPSSMEERERYVADLCKQIRHFKWKGNCDFSHRPVKSIFFGGGTPSTLSVDQTGRIMETICEKFEILPDAEITTELNPGTVSREKLIGYYKLGINRLSIGLQSSINEELEALGRIHTWEEFLETYHMAREAGFQNINIDLMSAIPGQTRESYERTLERVIELNPEHISAYSLIIEEGTPFFERYGEGRHEEELPDEETERWMYAHTKEKLQEYGYERYEISNYAKKGYECRHNLGYWERTDYLGFGSGAASLYEHCRFTSPVKRQRFGESEEVIRLSQQEEMEEFVFLGLRKMKGISVSEFKSIFGMTIEEVYAPILEELVREELLVWEEDRIRLSERGIDISNYVMSKFLLS